MEPVQNNNASTWWARNNPFREQTTTPAPQDQNRSSVSPDPDPNLQLADDEELVDDPNNAGKKLKQKKGSDDPMLKFDSLWHPNMDKDGKPIQEQNTNTETYLPQLDEKKFGESVSKMNFVGQIADTDMAAIVAGGEGAAKALVRIINGASQKAFSVAMSGSRRLTEQGFVNAAGRITADIPNHVRDSIATNGLSENITIMDNPAFAPMVQGVKDRFLSKFPKASPKQVQTAVKQYFDAFAQELTKGNTPPVKQGTNQDKLRKGSPDADFYDWIDADLKRSSSPFALQDNEDQV